MSSRSTVGSSAVALALLISAVIPAGVHAQTDSAVIANWIRDSTAYVQDSLAIDSIARVMPVDSLRHLYRLVPLSPPTLVPAVVQAMFCEGGRLIRRYGHAAVKAQARVQTEEWTRDQIPAVERALNNMGGRTTGDDGCDYHDVASRVPARLRSMPTRPVRGRSDRERIAIRDSIRNAHGWSFEATMSGARSGEFAGTASITWENLPELGISLRDKTLPGPLIMPTITLQHAGLEYLQAGSYVLLDEGTARDFPALAPGIMRVYPSYGGSDARITGTAVVEKSNTIGVEGHADFVVERNVFFPLRMRRMPAYTPDTLRFSVRFRAQYDTMALHNAREMARYLRTQPPHHAMPTTPAPDADETRRALARVDERTPCEQRKDLLPSSRFPTLPPGAGTAPVPMLVLLSIDWTGRTSGHVLLATDTLTERYVGNQLSGLRFAPADTLVNRGWRYTRCTLTLRPAP